MGFITREFQGHFNTLILLSLNHGIEIFPAWSAILLKNEITARKPLLNLVQLTVALAGVFLALLHIFFGSIM